MRPGLDTNCASRSAARPRPFGWRAAPVWGRFVARAWVFAFLLALFFAFSLAAEQRFPPPDFESGHKVPVTTQPAARGLAFEYLDVAVLAAALGVSTWLIYRKRSRKGLIALGIFSLLYFGFYRKGCICAIGSPQNISLALFDSTYAVPWVAVAFFVLPLAFSLFGGRSFCAGVCPHGALQDLVLLRPVKVPAWLEQGLSILPFVYLGAGVLFAATGSLFLFCQYDPFVPIFRLSGRLLMVLSGAALLLLGVFVGRPYCRFLCPFGALLKVGACVARFRVRVTPDYCTQCRLCEASCPFGAMREPHAVKPAPPEMAVARRRLAILLVLIPFLMAALGWAGSLFSGPASKLNPTVALAERFIAERETPPKTGALSADDLSLERARQDPQPILTQAIQVRHKFLVGGWIFGAWVGLVIGIKLVSASVHRQRTDYEPDRGDCFACARCFEYCPNELVRRGIMPSSELPARLEPELETSAREEAKA